MTEKESKNLLICKQLRFRSWHRGCKETDLVFGRFCDRYLDSLTPEQLEEYSVLLDQDDADVFAWLTGRQSIPEAMKQNSVMQMLLAFDVASGK